MGSLLAIMASLLVIAKVNVYRADTAIRKVAEEPEPTEITVWVKGAVKESVELILPVDSRICDLKAKINLSDDADKRFFRRRKRLKNREEIWVPKKRT